MMNSLMGLSSGPYLSVLMQVLTFSIITGLVMFAVWLFKHEEKMTVLKWSLGFLLVGLIGIFVTVWIMSNNTGMMNY